VATITYQTTDPRREQTTVLNILEDNNVPKKQYKNLTYRIKDPRIYCPTELKILEVSNIPTTIHRINYPTDIKVPKTLTYQADGFRRRQFTALLILEQNHLP